MSNDSRNSLSSSLWGVATAVLGSVVAVWLAIKLIEQIWLPLLLVVAVVLVVTAAVIVLRWWLRRRW